MNEITNPTPPLPEQIEEVIVSGDLKSLNPAQRVQYVQAVCKSLGLNHLTRPFDYILLNGKLTLYARKDATDQLRRIYGVSVTKVDREFRDDLYIVTTYVQDRDGRTDEGLAAVSVKGLQGEAKANALMKTDTKSKRRATLSLCGLGFLDETESDSVAHDPAERRAKVAETSLIVEDIIDPDDDLNPEPEPVATPEPNNRGEAETVLNQRMAEAGVSVAELDEALSVLYGEDTRWTELDDRALIRLAGKGWGRVLAAIEEGRGA